jgi:EmrB/QacA subfamily drug resistance transporter
MSTTAGQPAAPAVPEVPGNGVQRDRTIGKWWPLAAVCTAVFMLLIDVTVVNVALPDIQQDLHASFSDLEWVVDAYALTLAAFQLTSGSLGDRLGRKQLFIGGIGLFAVSSLACGLAPTAITLDWFRAVQGVGGAIMFANSLALLGQSYSGRDRGTAFGVWGATTGASVAIGPLVGGALTSGIGWRWIFFINLPIAALAVAISVYGLASPPRRAKQSIDVRGFVLFTLALVMFVLGLIRGNDDGWSSLRILGLLIGSVLLLIGFVAVELRTEQPMLDVRLFRRPAFVGAQVAAIGIAATLFALFLYLTLYFQDVLGFSAFQTGLRLMPITVMTFLVAPVAGKLSARVPFRWLIGSGLLVVGVGQLLMHGVTGTSSWTELLLGFFVAGVGSGMINPPLGALAVGVVEQERSGMGAGTNNTFRQVGLATGIAAYGVLFQNRVSHALTGSLPHLGSAPHHQLVNAVSSGGIQDALRHVPSGQRHTIDSAARAAFASGLNELVIVCGVVAIVAGLACFVLIRQRDLVSARRG